MNEKINKALKKIQFELGPYSDSHYENIFSNVKMYVVDGDSTRDITFTVTVDEKIYLLRINARGVEFENLPIGYTLMVNEERTLKLLQYIAEKINDNTYCKDIELPSLLINEIYVCEKSPKLYTKLEIDTQIRQHVEKGLKDMENHYMLKNDELKQEHEAHLNAVLADVYTDIFYGVKRKRCDNKLQSLKQKNLSAKRKVGEMVSPMLTFKKNFTDLFGGNNLQKASDSFLEELDRTINPQL
jgi:hypothetical protein